ncbi:acyltransferase [Mucilaginibacter terrenus]|uniref:Acyltransferase n=1 Tax=Mucilaginibacter terrenus TaxID=2482727 RepID=A0A3E2NXT2_9SPHI|nr:acyltransferase [Mucilaginibacter terrenus]RFZ85797.1 acyltransferase [Mucilaginibacter terrenus]
MSAFNKIIGRFFFKITSSGSYIGSVADAREEELYAALKFRGEECTLPLQAIIKNPQYISIGKKFSALYNLRLEAWDKYADQNFTPQLTIGEWVSMGTDVHIGCINKVSIGNYVLFGSRIYISDHSHGAVSGDELHHPPINRSLISKGPVIIEDNVWIGEGVCVMPNVRIGRNAIVGANAVVTKDVPPNAVVAGVPARVIKVLEV